MSGLRLRHQCQLTYQLKLHINFLLPTVTEITVESINHSSEILAAAPELTEASVVNR